MTIKIFKPLQTYSTDEAYGAVIDGLENGVNYSIKIIASNDVSVSPPSEPLDVMPFPTPTPQLPGKTTLVSADASSQNQINIEFEEPTTGTKPFDFVAKVIGGGQTIEVDPDAVAVQGSFFGVIKGLTKGTTYSVQVYTKNSIGSGQSSDAIQVNTPADIVNDPLIGGVSYQDATYKYCMFPSNMTTGYEVIRTPEGQYTEFEVLLCGAGGAGSHQTISFGKGGDGGGGQMVVAKLPAAYPGSIFVSVPNGGLPNGNNPENATVTEGSTKLVAISGKTANDKNDAAGYPTQEVPAGWNALPEFTWLTPVSLYVGGVAQSTEQNFPNATNCGEGGAGTKDSRPGKGGNSFVAIRWKK